MARERNPKNNTCRHKKCAGLAHDLCCRFYLSPKFWALLNLPEPLPGNMGVDKSSPSDTPSTPIKGDAFTNQEVAATPREDSATYGQVCAHMHNHRCNSTIWRRSEAAS